MRNAAGPAHAAFGSILDLMQAVNKTARMSEEDHRRHMDAAQGLLEYISQERNDAQG